MKKQNKLKLKSRETGETYRFESADGINSKNSFRKEELLLADKVNINEEDRVLIIQSGFGFLGTVLGAKADETVMYETSARATKFSRTNAQNNSIKGTKVVNKPEISDIEDSFDKIIYAPESYAPVDLVKRRLSQAANKTTEKGEIYISGKKKSGLKRYRKYLQQNSQKEKIGTQGNILAYKFSKISKMPEVDIEKHFKTELNNMEADFKTSEGLFSSGKLDEGTKILLENINLENPNKILDLGCGYGAISVFLSKKYKATFYLSDDNARASKYAKKNMEKSGAENFKIKTADCLDGFQDEKFDVIISNPPTHQGKGVTDKIFNQAAEALSKQGELWLVYNQNMRFEDELSEKFNKVEKVEQEDNFLVLKAVK